LAKYPDLMARRAEKSSIISLYGKFCSELMFEWKTMRVCMYVSVRMCVGERKRERERACDTERERASTKRRDRVCMCVRGRVCVRETEGA